MLVILDLVLSILYISVCSVYWAHDPVSSHLCHASACLAVRRAAKLILKAYDDLKARRSRAAAAAASAVTSTDETVCNKWRTVQHMYHKQMEVTADLKGKAMPNGPAGSHSGGEIVEQGDTNSCPICLDECAARTVTACGHYFCR